jgi:HK97 family phage major capsid protein
MQNIHALRRDYYHYFDEAEGLLNTAEKEKRDLSDVERRKFDVVTGKAQELGSQLRELERSLERGKLNIGATTPAFFTGPQESTGVFRTFGEQLRAVVEAGRPGAKIDERLFEARAGTGLNEAIGSEGGFLVQSDFALDLLNSAMAQAKIAPRCSPFPIGANSNGVNLPCLDEVSRVAGSRFGGLQLYWLNEGAEKQPSKPKFRKLHLELKKLCGLVYLTDEILQDSVVLEAFVRKALNSEFAFVLDDCIVRGLGGSEPLGILNSAALVTVPKEGGQAGKTITALNVLTMYSRLPAGSVDTAVWYYNVDAFAQIAGMTISSGTAGQPCYLPAGGLSGRAYATLLGLPLIPLEQCATLGQPADLILMDPAKYLIASKGGIQTALSAHVRFVFDESVLRAVFRLDGMPELNAPITPAQGTAQQSPYIVLAERK